MTRYFNIFVTTTTTTTSHMRCIPYSWNTVRQFMGKKLWSLTNRM